MASGILDEVPIGDVAWQDVVHALHGPDGAHGVLL